MSRPPVEVADIFRAHGPEFLRTHGAVVSPARKKILRKLTECRTAALGGHVETCSRRCGYERVAYNSCRNRHCPKCQASARAAWLEARQADLLPVEYFHVVFTVPAQVAQVALQNKRILYDMLFRASAESMKELAADPRHLGAQLGFIGLLHTWGQTLHHHPHIHYVVPGGGLAEGGKRWMACAKGFFLPVKPLARLFRGKFLAYLRQAFESGRLIFQGELAALATDQVFDALLATLYDIDWVVYAKPPFGGPEQVLKYLARYTHRVAIANARILSLRDGRVRFAYKDYARGGRQRVMTLDAMEFIRRFLLHVLPKGFVRMRHFGFLANPVRRERIARCRELLGVTCASQAMAEATAHDGELHEPQATVCPNCKLGHIVRRPLEGAIGHLRVSVPAGIDSS
jgi:hypothetical protein